MNIKRIGQSILPLLLIIETPINKILSKRNLKTRNRDKQNILIVGGSFFNKGAQAMSFTVVDQIKRRFPKKSIYLLLEYDFKDVNDSIFTFRTLPWTSELRFKLLNPLNRHLFTFYSKYRKYEKLLTRTLKNALMIIDISGYSFSSEIGQTWVSSVLDIMIAEKYNIDYYIFPQSIGPFNFSLLNRLFFFTLTRSFLTYPQKIFIRENDGLKFMKQISSKDLSKSYDIVLTNKEYDLENIYKRKTSLRKVHINSNSVGIIPNNKISVRIKEEEFLDLYSTIINCLIKSGKIVYILTHSSEDFIICEIIKNLFIGNEKVIFLNEDYNVFELENIIKQFDFVIASRYHSIVNSYRLKIPSFVIGWAFKYKELMDAFNQFGYYFDIKQKIDKSELENKLEKMIRDFAIEKKKISAKLDNILNNSQSCFDSLHDIKDKNVIKTKQLDLCLSCEACVAVCPVNAISMKLERGQFLPEVNLNLCTNCGICLRVCPGIDLNPLNISKTETYLDYEKKNIIACYTTYSKNEVFRKNSTSGGIITNLIYELLKIKEYDGAFALNFKNYDEEPVRLDLIDDSESLISSAGSKYLPASIFHILKKIKKEPNKKYIIVGTPCQFHSINKFLNQNRLDISENLLFLGLFCDTTLNFNFLNYIKQLYETKNNKIQEFQYRTKAKYGWPGHSKIIFNTGGKFILKRDFRMFCKRYFRLNRCLYCYDKLNVLADISFGDCYIKGKTDKEGKSNIIIRTRKGEQTFKECSQLFYSETETFKKIVKSQNLILKSKIWDYNKSIYGIKNMGMIDFLSINFKLVFARFYLRLGQRYSSFISFHFYILKLYKYLISHLKIRK